MAKMTRSELFQIANEAMFSFAQAEALLRIAEQAGVIEPDPVEKVERLEGFVYEHEYGLFSFNKTGESPFNKIVLSKRYVREVLPGDPDPDERVWTEEQVREIIKKFQQTYDLSNNIIREWRRAFGLEW